MHDFVDTNNYQPSLFFNSNPKHLKLMKAIDTVNRKYNSNCVRLASMDKKTFKMRQEHLSPAYTTKLADVIKVKIG